MFDFYGGFKMDTLTILAIIISILGVIESYKIKKEIEEKDQLIKMLTETLDMANKKVSKLRRKLES